VTAWLLAPVVFSLLLIAAHFLRAGNILFMLAALGLIGLVNVRRPWARRVLQVVLSLAALEWARMMLVTVEQRLAAGESWERLAIILSAVAVLAVASAALLELKRARSHFTQKPAGPEEIDAVGSEPR